MIQSPTLRFLRQLAKNNDKSWFDAHRPAYEGAKADYLLFVKELLKNLAGKDPSLSDLTPKSCVFRINRDVRFSKNKAPYKTHLGAYLCKGGKKSNLAGYYFHLEPGASFLGGGLWMPEAPALAKVRQEIDYCLEEFQSIVRSKDFRNTFDGLEQTHRLTRLPKGYEPGNPAEEYLRLKSFTAIRRIGDEELANPKSAAQVAKHLSRLTPLVGFLNRAVEETD
jgi:uncharacterized protein (TIGR02453 family)